MPRLISAPFFSANPVFRRAEYAAAVGRRPQDRVVTAMLAQHLQAGNIRRIARGVFASVPKHADAATWSVDRFLAASRLRQCCTIAYHSALELQGYAYTEGHDVQVIAQGEPGLFEAAGFACRFVRPPPRLRATGWRHGDRSPGARGRSDDDRANDRRSVRPLRSGRWRGGTLQLPGSGGSGSTPRRWSATCARSARPPPPAPWASGWSTSRSG